MAESMAARYFQSFKYIDVWGPLHEEIHVRELRKQQEGQSLTQPKPSPLIVAFVQTL